MFLQLFNWFSFNTVLKKKPTFQNSKNQNLNNDTIKERKRDENAV